MAGKNDITIDFTLDEVSCEYTLAKERTFSLTTNDPVPELSVTVKFALTKITEVFLSKV